MTLCKGKILIRKLSLLLFLLIMVVLYSGCNIYKDYSKNNMDVTGVKVFDSENNEVIGSYKNYYRDIYNYSKVSYKVNLIPMNSAAPVFNYYTIDAEEEKAYVLKIYFHSEKGYKLSKVSYYYSDINELTENEFESTDIEKVNNDYVVTININKIDSTNQLYTVKGWYSGDNENTFSSKGSNTYIKGAFFNLPNENKLIC